jgi:uncharacterized protein (DUF1800 family)
VPTSKADVAHLLRRAGFGGTPAEIAALTPYDRDEVVERVLDTTAAPPVDTPADLTSPDLADWEKAIRVMWWWYDRMATSPTPIVEKMSLFWHGHFCSSIEKVGRAETMFQQVRLFHTDGLGSFPSLCRKVALGPAMLLYLDNAYNVAGSPNENFARELMELFTLGVNQYTQDDVVASARAWTGHGLSDDLTRYVFHRDRHDGGQKTFFGRTRNWDGPQVVDEIVTGRKKRVAAAFLATKLWTFLAYPGPEPAVVDAVVADYLAGGYEVKRLLRSIFLHPQFWSEQARTGLVRSPTEVIVAALKATGIRAKSAHPEWWAHDMGQALLYPPNVSGWRPNAYWISSTALWARAGFARYLTWQAWEKGVLKGSERHAPADAVQRAFDVFGVDRPSTTTRQALVDWVVAERTAHGWAEVPNLITLSMLTPDFQLA